MKIYVGMESGPDEGTRPIEIGRTEHEAILLDIDETSYPLLSTMSSWGRDGHYCATKIPELLREIDGLILSESKGGTKLESIRDLIKEAKSKGRPVSFWSDGVGVSSTNVFQSTEGTGEA